MPAFFGYQRFGSKRPVTHIIGKFLLLGDWCQAIDFIIGYPYSYEHENTKRARSLFLSGDLKESMKEFPDNFTQEKNLIKNLLKFNNCYQALKNSLIPIRFYLEAYQSYLFNRILSRELEYIKPDEYPYKILKVPVNRSSCEDDICRDIFDEEGLNSLDLTNKVIKVKLNSLVRKAFMQVYDLNLKNNTLEFTLDRGMYATIVLRELIRGDPRMFT